MFQYTWERHKCLKNRNEINDENAMSSLFNDPGWCNLASSLAISQDIDSTRSNPWEFSATVSKRVDSPTDEPDVCELETTFQHS